MTRAYIFHVAKRFEASARYQSVAVLLSRKIQVSEAMKKFYQSNLRQALSSADISFDTLGADIPTERLLEIPGVRGNIHIQKFYGLKASP